MRVPIEDYDLDKPRGSTNRGLGYAGLFLGTVTLITALGAGLSSCAKREYTKVVEGAKEIPALVQQGHVSKAAIRLEDVQKYRLNLADSLRPDALDKKPLGLDANDLARLNYFVSEASNAVHYAEELNRKHLRDTESFIKEGQRNTPFYLPAKKR